jgi:GH25 family lysozyme M1 (1,4-beta-N-acetylmuramidase)
LKFFQVIDTVNHLRQSGANFGMLWFDIEGSWPGSVANNINFIHGLINQANAMGIRWGIYTSRSQWGPITGDTAQFGAPALWYAHYDGSPSFSDFAPFAGWSHPSIKQFAGTTSLCGAGVDKNFY